MRLQELRMKMGAFSIVGLVIAWQLFPRVYPDLFAAAIRLFRFS